jgi:hypothetical protein
LWQISDQDSQEFRLIKSSIIEAIEFQLKWQKKSAYYLLIYSITMIQI